MQPDLDVPIIVRNLNRPILVGFLHGDIITDESFACSYNQLIK